MPVRRFPRPWSIEDIGAAFVSCRYRTFHGLRKATFEVRDDLGGIHWLEQCLRTKSSLESELFKELHI
jgi:hypothetical protein